MTRVALSLVGLVSVASAVYIPPRPVYYAPPPPVYYAPPRNPAPCPVPAQVSGGYPKKECDICPAQTCDCGQKPQGCLFNSSAFILTCTARVDKFISSTPSRIYTIDSSDNLKCYSSLTTPDGSALTASAFGGVTGTGTLTWNDLQAIDSTDAKMVFALVTDSSPTPKKKIYFRTSNCATVTNWALVNPAVNPLQSNFEIVHYSFGVSPSGNTICSLAEVDTNTGNDLNVLCCKYDPSSPNYGTLGFTTTTCTINNLPSNVIPISNTDAPNTKIAINSAGYIFFYDGMKSIWCAQISNGKDIAWPEQPCHERTTNTDIKSLLFNEDKCQLCAAIDSGASDDKTIQCLSSGKSYEWYKLASYPHDITDFTMQNYNVFTTSATKVCLRQPIFQ